MGPLSLLQRAAASAMDRSTATAVRRVELRLRALVQAAQLLPAVTAVNAASERARIQEVLRHGGSPVPRWQLRDVGVPRGAFRMIDELHEEVQDLPASGLYAAKLDELELDLTLMDCLGDARRVRPVAARRFETGASLVQTPLGRSTLGDYARGLLTSLDGGCEPQTLVARGAQGEPSLASIILGLAHQVGLDVEVKVEPRLAAGAATGERVIYIADRQFGQQEAMRLAVHEVLGHLVSAANGRTQPLRLLEFGTADAFADQEGVALYLERQHGLLDDQRLRVLAARVLATEMMHAQASFADTAHCLLRDHGFALEVGVAIAERAYRGGGVARDAGYLLGLLRVGRAIDSGETSLDEMRCGRVSLSALPHIRQLTAWGLARPSAYRPNFSRSLRSTTFGTTPSTLPPRDAISLIRLELT